MKIKEALQLLSNIEKRPITQVELAKMLGYTKQYLSELNTSNKSIPQIKLKILEEKYNLDFKKNVATDSCILIPVLDVSVGLGDGITVENEAPYTLYPIAESILTSLGANKNRCEIIYGKGNSMYPTIDSGDALLVDKSRKEVYDGRIYAIRYEGQCVAKRLQKIPPKKLNVISDNPQYESFKIDFSTELDFDFEIIGEVLWWCRISK